MDLFIKKITFGIVLCLIFGMSAITYCDRFLY